MQGVLRAIFGTCQFEKPAFIISCHKLCEVEKAFSQMEKALARGFYLAGFLSYEGGYAFEKVFQNNRNYGFPLVYFGAFDKDTSPPNPLSIIDGEGAEGKSFVLEKAGVRIKKEYLSSIKAIKSHLVAGDTYQVNYTFKQKIKFQGDSFLLYQTLKKRQPTPYSAFIETKDFSILSLSPELFFKKQKDTIMVKPMKGTIEPGKRNARRLKDDPKNRSENLMIVDLLRNDLGRIAKPGTVKTTRLFEVEEHPTLYQMTSTVEAKIAREIDMHTLFKNIFPSGSVTGAPKIRTMQIIQELEKEERNIYTGSIGYITPQRDMFFNVAIRTLLLSPFHDSRFTFHGELGIGSGITYDSDPQKEYEECLLKAKFLAA